MTGSLTEQAADLAIDATCRSLRLPTVRLQAGALAEAAVRDRLTHRAYLAEVLGAEVDERDGRRRERRIAEARFPRTKRLEDFDLAAAPSIPPATLAGLTSLAWVAAGEPVVLLGDPGTGKTHSSSSSGPRPARRASGSATPRPRPWSTSSPRRPTSGSSPAPSPGTRAWTSSASTSSATSASTPGAPSSCSR